LKKKHKLCQCKIIITVINIRHFTYNSIQTVKLIPTTLFYGFIFIKDFNMIVKDVVIAGGDAVDLMAARILAGRVKRFICRKPGIV
jgi:hypothetical protein